MDAENEIAKRNPKGGRPKKADAPLRDQQLIVRVTVLEKAEIAATAQAAGMSLSDYVRARTLRAGPLPRAVVREADPALLSELNAIGVNVNQLARAIHRDSAFQKYWHDIGLELRRVLARVAGLR